MAGLGHMITILVERAIPIGGVSKNGAFETLNGEISTTW